MGILWGWIPWIPEEKKSEETGNIIYKNGHFYTLCVRINWKTTTRSHFYPNPVAGVTIVRNYFPSGTLSISERDNTLREYNICPAVPNIWRNDICFHSKNLLEQVRNYLLKCSFIMSMCASLPNPSFSWLSATARRSFDISMVDSIIQRKRIEQCSPELEVRVLYIGRYCGFPLKLCYV